jgi:hypothetical protein
MPPRLDSTMVDLSTKRSSLIESTIGRRPSNLRMKVASFLAIKSLGTVHLNPGVPRRKFSVLYSPIKHGQ